MITAKIIISIVMAIVFFGFVALWIINAVMEGVTPYEYEDDDHYHD